MIAPNKVSGVNCLNRLEFIRSYDGTYASGLTEQLKASFEASPDYVEVYRNYNFDKTYKTRIFEGNDADKKLGYKYLQSYPYDLPQFCIGDYIHWKYDHVKLSTWLMLSLDTQHLYDVKGRIALCNNWLKWIDADGNLQEYECVFQDSLTYASFKYGEKGVNQVNGTIVILVQQNENTRKIYRNQRFLFNGIPYMVNNFIRSVNSNFLEIKMFETQRVDKDDLINNIAYNGVEQVDVEVETETKITPEITEIYEGDEEVITIERYVDGYIQPDTYEFSVSGVPESCYEFTVINENSFSVRNLKQYDKGSLHIECLNTQTGEITAIDLWLVGGW